MLNILTPDESGTKCMSLWFHCSEGDRTKAQLVVLRLGLLYFRQGHRFMKLIGNYLSPYTRRVAISLHELEMPFELDHVMVFDEPQKVKPHNPVTRVPTLVLDDGAVLVESYAILDELDQMDL